MHKGEIRFVSPARIEQRWFHYVGPKEQGATHWFLERGKVPEATPEAAPQPAPAPKDEKPETDPKPAGRNR